MNRRCITRWLIPGVVAITMFQVARLVLPCKPRCTFWLWNEATWPSIVPDAPLLSPDGSRLATIFEGDGLDSVAVHIHVWECANGRLVADLWHENATFDNVAFSPDGRKLAAVGSTGVCVVWDVASGMTLSHAKLEGAPDDLWTPCVVFGPDGEPLVADPELTEANLTIWNGATGQRLATQEPKGSIVFKDGSIVGMRSSRRHNLAFYDVAARRRTATIPTDDLWEQDSHWWPCVDHAPRSGILARTRPDQQCLIVLDTTSHQARTIPVSDRIPDLATLRLSPDGRLVALGSCFRPTEAEPFVPQAVMNWLFPDDGDNFRYGNPYEVVLYDTRNGRATTRLPGYWALFSPDGRRLVVFSEEWCAERENSGSQARVYDLPLRGPMTASVLFALGCGGAALFVTRRLKSGDRAA
jgi:WD40 repeat protein